MLVFTNDDIFGFVQIQYKKVERPCSALSRLREEWPWIRFVTNQTTSALA